MENKVEDLWKIYNDHAGTVDSELIKDWKGTLDTLLIFGALFTAVLTAFIIESIKLLQRDVGEMTRDILLTISHQLANTSMPAFEQKAFTPDAWAVRVNYLFFMSISCSLVAALGAVLALQWIGSYDFGLIKSSMKSRAVQRQLRYNGIEKWKLAQIISALPLLIYISVFLFLVGLANWLWHIHRRVSGVVITGLVVAGMLYVATHTISVFDIGAPFRTPVSRSLPYICRKLHLWIILIGFSFIQLVKGEWVKKWWLLLHDHDETARLWQLMKHRTMKLHQLWPKLRSSFSALLAVVMTPAEAKFFDHRERQAIKLGRVLDRDCILWLARNIDDLPSSRSRFVSLFREAALIPIEELTDSRMNAAPWSAIFDNVFGKFYEEEGTSPKRFSKEELAELETLLKAAAFIGTFELERPARRNFSYLCRRFLDVKLNDIWIFAGLALWKCLGYEDIFIANRRHDNGLILVLPKPCIYMVLHRIYHPRETLDTRQHLLVHFLSPLTSPEYYKGDRPLLDHPVILILMHIVIYIQGYNSYPGYLWERYFQAISKLPSSDHNDYNVLRTCHRVILFHLLSHAPGLPDIRDKLFCSLIQVDYNLEIFRDVRPIMLMFLKNMVKKDEGSLTASAMTLLSVIVSWPEHPTTTSPGAQWAGILEACDQILNQKNDSGFSLELLISTFLLAAKTTEYRVDHPREAKEHSLDNPLILIFASLILPVRYSLTRLKSMEISPEMRTNPSVPDLLKAWCTHYIHPSQGDIDAECMVLMESAEVQGANYMTDYIHRQSNQAAYWDVLLTKHMTRLLSNPMAAYILKQIQGTASFPDHFFKNDGITWAVIHLKQLPNNGRPREDIEELILHCIKQSKSSFALRNSLRLAVAYVEANTFRSSHPNYGPLLETLHQVPIATGNLTFWMP
ncbi:hypothetical protein PIIN_05675 [Serendipita indica DSM 11827]|uniref:DUF6535 domain-containing protein n=1 Tax=Serendipita indica (strain DSM 11827) TaxID=1109443 RepID=G4TKA9_SERID|nr:hypothetical protein PIIN_05675 [Serendipita indica DSM 11827]